MGDFDRVPATNRLITALPSKDRSRLLANCEAVELMFGDVLNERGSRIGYVYFPTDSFISLVTAVDRTAGLEVGLVGNEGMYGVWVALGSDVSPLHALVQDGGPALRMSTAAFKREYGRSPALQRELNRYVCVLMSQLAQSAACTRFHVVEARLARWLLMAQDRARMDRFHVTHIFLAWMLGVRRASITKAANALQVRNLLGYKRGEITVLNRRGLEAAACSCYQFDKSLYQRILGKNPQTVRRKVE